MKVKIIATIEMEVASESEAFDTANEILRPVMFDEGSAVIDYSVHAAGEQFTIVTGDPIDGINLIGVFDCFSDAQGYVDTHRFESNWWITSIDSAVE
jgi:hypothetical protein